jgi:SAM-dependent methyltransferase
MDKKYIGSELDLFSEAVVWKKYWFRSIEMYLGKNILDIGAGIGATATLFLDKNVDSYTALEPDLENFNKIKKNKDLINAPFRLNCIHGDISSLEENSLFDTILFIDVLEHILDDSKELEEASKHLLPKGKIIVLSPAHDFLYSPFDKAVGHYRRYNKKSLISIKPSILNTEHIFYLDSIGILISIINRYILRSKTPNKQQIKFWNKIVIPASKVIDRVASYSFGKTVVCVFCKK